MDQRCTCTSNTIKYTTINNNNKKAKPPDNTNNDNDNDNIKRDHLILKSKDRQEEDCRDGTTINYYSRN